MVSSLSFRRLFCLLPVLLLVGAGACNFPGAQNALPDPLDATLAYASVHARLTETGLAAVSSPTRAVQVSPTSFQPTRTLTPALEISPSATRPTRTPTSSPVPTTTCNQAAAGSPIDVTIADDTEMLPGESFTKIWRLQNTGSCTWTEAYAARLFSGSRMGAPESVSLDGNVSPGESVEISVDMVAPQKPGTYQGNWKLQNAAGQLFGIGPNSSAPFWVRIVVLEPPTDTPAPVTATFTPTLTSTVTVTPTVTPAPTLTETVTVSPTASATETAVVTATLTATPEPTLTETATLTPTAATDPVSWIHPALLPAACPIPGSPPGFSPIAVRDTREPG